MLAAAAALVLCGTARAGAEPVANGGFESGDLSGWTQLAQFPEGGAWSVVDGTQAPVSDPGPYIVQLEAKIATLTAEIAQRESEGKASPARIQERERKEAELAEVIAEREAGLGAVPVPLSGSYDAVADQSGENSLILSQDIALEPGVPQHLSLFFGYHSYRPMAVPGEDTLAVGGPGTPANQQVRVDLMRPGSDPASLAPGDVLATLFASEGHSDPEQLPWTQLTADLSPYAGRTVRLRIAVVDTESVLNAGVDAVTVAPTLLPQVSALPAAAPPSSDFSFGRVLSDARRGTAKLTLKLPGPGVVSATSAAGPPGAGRPVKPATAVRRATLESAGAGTVRLSLRPTAAARRYLKAKGSLRARVAVTFTATGGEPKTAERSVVLELAQSKRR